MRSGKVVHTALVVAVALAGILAVVGTAAAAQAQDEGPRAEAGLDQNVTRGASVLLDATPSWAPDAEVVDYEWSVISPLDEPVDPECEVPSCRLANFTAAEHGTYAVELRVTDEEGRTAVDELYVASEAGNEFDVELDGPDSSGGVGTLTAEVTAGNATLQHLLWYDEDSLLENRSLSGLGGTHERPTDLDAGETYAVAVHAADGRVVGDVWTAPTPSGAVQEYPYIEGPDELTGDPDYESGGEYVYDDVTYRVRTGVRSLEPEVVWSRDGATVARGRYYTDDFSTGTHELSATVTLADTNLSDQAFDSVGGDVSANLGAFYGDETARKRIVANPGPEVSISRIGVYGGLLRIRGDVSRTSYQIDNIEVRIDGEYITTASQSALQSGRLYAEAPSDKAGEMRVSLVAEDVRGESTKESRHVVANGF